MPPAPPILIATILRGQGPTGVETHIREVMRYLQSEGAAVELTHSFSSPAVYPAVALRRVIGKLSPPASVWWHEAAHEALLQRVLRKRLATGQPTVIYAQCPISARAALQARANKQQRVVLVVHFNESQALEWADKGMITREGRIWQGIVAREVDVLPRVDGLVFVSEFMQRCLMTRVPAISRVPSAIIPNFVRAPGTDATADLPPSDLVSIGTLEPRKNQAYLIEIIAALHKLGQPLTLTLIGDGPDRQRLQELAGKLGVGDAVRFAGFVSGAGRHLSKFRAYMHGARIENLPISLVEALSHGLPIFAPAVGGIPELFEDGREGSLIPLDDPDGAARMIAAHFGNTPWMAQAAEAAKLRFKKDLDASVVAARLFRFLGGKPIPA